jgi:predicted anti-sigma-YlaC factor YlaD
MMKCKDFNEFLGEYLEGELDEKTRTVFEAHLQMCPPCVGYLDSYQEVIRVGKACCCDPEAEVPEDAPQSLINAILAARKAG